MKNNKILMIWLQFIVWTSTIALTFLYNRDVSILSIVSGVFVATNSWLFKLRFEEKKNGQV